MLEFNTNIPLKTIIATCKKTDYQEEFINDELKKQNEKLLRIAFLDSTTTENLPEKEIEYFSNYHFNPKFMDQMTIYSEIDQNSHSPRMENLISYIGPCYNSFLYNVLYSLNIKPEKPVKDDESLSKTLKIEIEKLQRVKTEEELKKQFPLIYKDYDKEQKKLNISEFIKYQARLYRIYVEKRNIYKQLIQERKKIISIEDYLENRKYNEIVKKYLAPQKILLYMAYHYSEKCKKILNNCQDKDLKTIIKAKTVMKKPLTFIEKYIDYSYENTQLSEFDYSKLTIEINQNEWVDVYTIAKEVYEEINKRLQPKEYLIDNNIVEESREAYTQKTFFESSKAKAKEVSKSSFYTSHCPEFVIKDRNPKGYKAHVYLNGKVILDRVNSPSGKAYVLDIADLKSQMKISINKQSFPIFSKTTLIRKRKEGVITQVIHNSSWQSKIEKVINLPATEDVASEMEEVLQLIKRR